MESDRDDETLTEGGYLNLTGKIMLASLGAWMLGKVVNTKIRGNQSEVSAITNALLASRRFQDELRRPGASVQSVIEKLQVKNMTAVEFERVLGVRWPL